MHMQLEIYAFKDSHVHALVSYCDTHTSMGVSVIYLPTIVVSNPRRKLMLGVLTDAVASRKFYA